MTLKSVKLIKFKKGRQRKPIRELVTGGITALLGTALLAETATLIRRI